MPPKTTLRAVLYLRAQATALNCRREDVSLSPAAISVEPGFAPAANVPTRCVLPIAAQLLLAAHERPPKRMILQYAAGAANRRAVPMLFILLAVFGVLAGTAGLLINFTECYAAAERISRPLLSSLLTPSGHDRMFVLWAARSLASAALCGVLIVVSRKILNGKQSARGGAIFYGWAGLFLAAMTTLLWTCGGSMASLYGQYNGAGLAELKWSFTNLPGALKVLLIETAVPGMMLFAMATKRARRFFGGEFAGSTDPTSPTIPTAQASASPARAHRRAARRAA